MSATYPIQNIPGTVLIMTIAFFPLSTTSSHLHPLLIKNCHSNSRLEVEVDYYNSKFELEMFNTARVTVAKP